MNINVKKILILACCVTVSACATNAPLNHSSAHHTKIQTVNLEQLNENITINAGGDVNKINAFKVVQRNLNDFSSNAVLKEALQHNMLDGKAFGDEVVVGSGSSKSASSAPVLTPVVIMSADYGVVNVVLIKRKSGKKDNVIYSSLQKVGSHSISNKQYWVENPLVLKEKIVNGLYDVAGQFANDANSK